MPASRWHSIFPKWVDVAVDVADVVTVDETVLETDVVADEVTVLETDVLAEDDCVDVAVVVTDDCAHEKSPSKKSVIIVLVRLSSASHWASDGALTMIDPVTKHWNSAGLSVRGNLEYWLND